MPINFKMLQARSDAGLTQKAAAELLGVSREVFNAWENGRLPTPRTRMTQLLKLLAPAMAEAAANSALAEARVEASTDPRVQSAAALAKPQAQSKALTLPKHPCPEHMTERMQSTHHQTWDGPEQAAYYRAVGKEVGGGDAAVLKEVRWRYFQHTTYLVHELGMEPYAPQKQDDLI